MSNYFQQIDTHKIVEAAFEELSSGVIDTDTLIQLLELSERLKATLEIGA